MYIERQDVKRKGKGVMENNVKQYSKQDHSENAYLVGRVILLIFVMNSQVPSQDVTLKQKLSFRGKILVREYITSI